MNERVNLTNSLKNRALSLINTHNLNDLDKVELLNFIDKTKKVIRALYSENLIISQEYN